ncbi:LamG domain-containing protein [Amycolatopsis sp. NPDC021455]|uniref:LamG domain-containing protein n=1 Tax=Amycolatopsis sp. NPDC021455 TaxID=3154901 RepID=UPI0033FDA009
MTGPIAATRMGRRLTAPFERGADTLSLGLTLFASSQATVDDYDFSDHFARFGVLPQPRYVLGVTRDFDVDTTVRLDYDEPGSVTLSSTVTVPAGTVAGTTFLFDNPVTVTARARVLTMQPGPDDNSPQNWLTLTALLGTTAKLLWVVGAERELLRGHAARTLAQRHVSSAVGLSLDIIGHDLGVPRFPPLSHSFDAGTVALYHLDDPKSPAADVAAGFPGRTGSSGTLSADVQVGVPGRYGTAMAFRTAAAVVTAPSSTDFDIDGDATIECFVRPDPDTGEGPVISKNPDPGEDSPGWVLRIGDAGSEVRFTISDGTTVIDVCAEVTLPADRFTHIAAVVDRSVDRGVSVYVDGVFQAFRFLFPLDTVATTANLLIGAAGGGFRGVVDEVRISSVARQDFAPVLGESDEHYRRRLALFRRWTLPTPANLAAVLNELVGRIGPPPEPGETPIPPLVVDDTNATLVRGTRLVHIRPKTLRPGESIDAAGRRNTAEAAVVGTAGQEELFDPDFLFRYERSDVDFAPAPIRALGVGERPADPHLLQVGVAERLDRLVADLAAALPGRLLVDSAFDPQADDLRATGRAVLLGHSSKDLGKLAALAHRAGFDYVSHRASAGRVYAAAAPGDYFAIDLGTGGAGPTDLDAGATVTLSLRPAPPADAFLHWVTVPTTGAGRAVLTPAGGTGTPQRTATLLATAAGRVVVKADVIRNGRTVSATRVLRVGLTDLPDGRNIAADGSLVAPESIVDPPDLFFDAVFLVRHDDPRVDYSTDGAHLVQPAVAELLDALLAELARRNVGGRLAVTAGPTGTQGRQLLMRHSVLTPGALAGVAFAVGFSHVQHKARDVIIRQAPGQLVAVTPTSGGQGAVIELLEGDDLELMAHPAPPLAGLTGQVPGEGPRLGWSSGAFDNASITLTSSTRPVVTLHAESAGTAWVQAGYLVGGQPSPYTFQVRLRPGLDDDTTVITKDQHDLIMNVLNVLHPIGVEVNTAAIRAHVIDLRTDDLLQANPDFTYPKFRVRGPLPPQVRRPAHG